jgi:hypothetical protein
MPLKKLGAMMFFLRMGDIQSKISSWRWRGRRDKRVAGVVRVDYT